MGALFNIYHKTCYAKTMIEMVSKSPAETQKIARALAAEIMARRASPIRKPVSNGASVIALSGNLGSGKTTFAQGFAGALGIKEKVASPTFVLLKIYPITKKFKGFKYFIHIDCYRLDSPKDLLDLGMKDFLKDRNAVILIEWVERVEKLLPKDAVRIQFFHKNNSRERVLIIKL